MENKYIFIGETVELPEIELVKGSVYFGDKIDEVLEKYKNLPKLLIKTSEFSGIQKDKNYLDKVRENLLEEIKEVKGE